MKKKLVLFFLIALPVSAFAGTDQNCPDLSGKWKGTVIGLQPANLPNRFKTSYESEKDISMDQNNLTVTDVYPANTGTKPETMVFALNKLVEEDVHGIYRSTSATCLGNKIIVVIAQKGNSSGTTLHTVETYEKNSLGGISYTSTLTRPTEVFSRISFTSSN